MKIAVTMNVGKLACRLFLFASGYFIFPTLYAVYSMNPTGCESRLMSPAQLKKELSQAKIYSIDKMDPTHYRLGLGIHGNREFTMADFYAVDSDAKPGIESPKNSIATYEFDLLLGSQMNVSVAILFQLNGQDGVLEIQPQTSSGRKSKRPRIPRSSRYNQSLFDFLIHLRQRPNCDIVMDKDKRLCMTNNWLAFGLSHASETQFQLNTRQAGHLRMAWRLASPDLKNRILKLTPQILEEKLGSFLSPIQLRQLWERTEYLQRD